jgi:phage-related protein
MRDPRVTALPSYSRTGIILKPVEWIGDSRRTVRSFPVDARAQTGRELFRLQVGADPLDWKPMHSIGSGACEIRVHARNEYRVIYVAKYAEAVFVLHAFIKKSAATRLQDMRTARERYRTMLERRGRK